MRAKLNVRTFNGAARAIDGTDATYPASSRCGENLGMYLESRALKENESEEPGGEGRGEKGTGPTAVGFSVSMRASVTSELRIADCGFWIGIAVRTCATLECGVVETRCAAGHGGR